MMSHLLSPTISGAHVLLLMLVGNTHYGVIVIALRHVFSRPDGILQCGYPVAVSIIEGASVCTS